MSAPDPRRHWLQFSLRKIFLSLTAIGLIFALFAYRERVRLQAEEFDGEKWRDSARNDDGHRLAMGDGLVARGDLKGMHRSAIIEMLGPPSAQEYFQDWDLVYRLGRERGFIRIDSEWLVIRLGNVG